MYSLLNIVKYKILISIKKNNKKVNILRNNKNLIYQEIIYDL